MKVLIQLFVYALCLQSCNDFRLTQTRFTLHSARILNGGIELRGSDLLSVNQVYPQSSNLTGHNMTIESKSSNSLFIRLTHSSSNSLALAVGTVLTFVVSSAQAQTTVNLSIQAETPSGAVMAFNLPACPTGWSELDGTGGRPDIRGRTIIAEGQGAGLTNRTLGDSGGSESHTLTIDQMPVHTHNSSVKVLSDIGDTGSPSGSYFATISGGQFSTPVNGYDSTMAADSVEIAPAGSGLPHNIMQPYLVLKYCQKN